MQTLGFSLTNFSPSAPEVSPSAARHNFTYLLSSPNSSKRGFKPGVARAFYKLLMPVDRNPGWRNSCHSLKVRCDAKDQNDDGFYIRRCVEIARKALGFTSPNPMVGCVIVKDGKVVGEGFHPKAGQPHAEVFALRDAGDLAEGAIAYVSLEPCNHFGRTPPCTEALIKAKVKKVVVGMVDPNPIVASKGVDRLRDSGIEVVVSVEEELCKSLNEAYIHRMLTGRPFLTLRYSLSVNGHLLDQLGYRVTDAGGYYSRLLQEYDAVVLSSSSMRENFSIPSSQEPGANQPIRIIINKNPSLLNQNSVAIKEDTGKVIVFTDNRAAVTEMAQQEIKTIVLDQINLVTILDYCNRQGLCSVLLDLRGNSSDFEELIKEGIEKKYFNKFITEILPVWNGCVKEDHLKSLMSLEQGANVINLHSKTSDHGVVIEGYFKY